MIILNDSIFFIHLDFIRLKQICLASHFPVNNTSLLLHNDRMKSDMPFL
jgi:hypothetical protein